MKYARMPDEPVNGSEEYGGDSDTSESEEEEEDLQDDSEEEREQKLDALMNQASTITCRINKPREIKEPTDINEASIY